MKAFEFIDLLLRQALGRVQGCQCDEGCLECVASPVCKERNEVTSKAGSEAILKSLLNIEIDVDALPMGPEGLAPAGVETVVLAQPVPPRDRRALRVVDEREATEGLSESQSGVSPEAGRA